MSQRRSFIRSRARQVVLLVVVGIVVFLTFETVVRLVPPDGARFTRAYTTQSGMRHVETVTYRMPQDARDITSLDNSLNNQQVVAPGWLNLNPICEMTPADTDQQETVVFTWHGLPTQVWTVHNCSSWSRTSGGIPDPWGRG